LDVRRFPHPRLAPDPNADRSPIFLPILVSLFSAFLVSRFIPHPSSFPRWMLDVRRCRSQPPDGAP
jgi:hypothetical protein